VQLSKVPLAVTSPDQTARRVTDGLFSPSHESFVVAFDDGSLNLVHRWTKKIHRVQVSSQPVRRLREEDRDASLFFMSTRS